MTRKKKMNLNQITPKNRYEHKREKLPLTLKEIASYLYATAHYNELYKEKL